MEIVKIWKLGGYPRVWIWAPSIGYWWNPEVESTLPEYTDSIDRLWDNWLKALEARELDDLV